jgi:hypothetical protein
MKLVYVLLVVATAVYADWRSVQRIASGERIQVVTARERTRGTFVMADDAVLVLQSEAGEQSLQRGDVQRVLVADPSGRIRSGILKAAIGAGAGLVIGWAICPHCANEGSGGKYTGPLTAAGAGIGALAGFLPVPYRTVYRR